MKEKVLQSIADGLITKLANASHDDIFNFYFEMALWYDNFCIKNFNFYLT